MFLSTLVNLETFLQFYNNVFTCLVLHIPNNTKIQIVYQIYKHCWLSFKYVSYKCVNKYTSINKCHKFYKFPWHVLCLQIMCLCVLVNKI